MVEGCGGYCNFLVVYLGVSKHRGTPKWMVYDGKPLFKMDDLGVPLFVETPILRLPGKYGVIWFRETF